MTRSSMLGTREELLWALWLERDRLSRGDYFRNWSQYHLLDFLPLLSVPDVSQIRPVYNKSLSYLLSLSYLSPRSLWQPLLYIWNIIIAFLEFRNTQTHLINFPYLLTPPHKAVPSTGGERNYVCFLTLREIRERTLSSYMELAFDILQSHDLCETVLPGNRNIEAWQVVCESDWPIQILKNSRTSRQHPLSQVLYVLSRGIECWRLKVFLPSLL